MNAIACYRPERSACVDPRDQLTAARGQAWSLASGLVDDGSRVAGPRLSGNAFAFVEHERQLRGAAFAWRRTRVMNSARRRSSRI